jgi:hypothetical protein
LLVIGDRRLSQYITLMYHVSKKRLVVNRLDVDRLVVAEFSEPRRISYPTSGRIIL